jgi:hypothetical protein
MVMQRRRSLRPMTLEAHPPSGKDDGVGDQVAGEDPGAFVGAGAERAGDVGQGDVGDGGVEHFHEGGARATVMAISQGLTRGFHVGFETGHDPLVRGEVPDDRA